MTDGEAITRPARVTSELASEGQSPVARLYAELAPELRRFVLGVIRDPELTADVMQATFVKVAEQGHLARVESSKGWLFKVAFHEALASRRRRASRERNQSRLTAFRPRTDPAPDEKLLQDETIEAVRNALGQIPEDQRRVILARIYEDKTFAQIAGELNLPLGTVLTRMRRGLEKLRNTLRPGG